MCYTLDASGSAFDTNQRSEVPIAMNGAAPNGGQAQGTPTPTNPKG